MTKTMPEVADYIVKNGYQFEIELSREVKLRRPLAEVLQEYPNLEDYFRHIADLHHQEELGVNVFSKNGSSIKRRGFFFVSIPAVATRVATGATDVATNVAMNVAMPVAAAPEILGHIDPPCPIHGPFAHAHPQMLSNMDNTQAQILQVKLDFAQQKAQDFERRNKELERKNDELYTENTKLIRENLLHKDKLDLEYKHKELDLANEKSGGLNGIMDRISNLPPEGWNLIAGLFPNHPMNKPAQAALEGVKKHADPAANQCIEVISEALTHQSKETIGMVSLVLEHYLMHPDQLKRTYNRMQRPVPATTPAAAITENPPIS